MAMDLNFDLKNLTGLLSWCIESHYFRFYETIQYPSQHIMKLLWLISSLAPASTVATMMGAAGQQDMAGAGGYYFTPVSSPVSPSPYVLTTQTASTTAINTGTTTTLSGAGTVTLANAQVFCPNRLPNAIDNCWFLMTIISSDSYVFPFFS
jgi:hypothetical protein